MIKTSKTIETEAGTVRLLERADGKWNWQIPEDRLIGDEMSFLVDVDGYYPNIADQDEDCWYATEKTCLEVAVNSITNMQVWGQIL